MARGEECLHAEPRPHIERPAHRPADCQVREGDRRAVQTGDEVRMAAARIGQVGREQEFPVRHDADGSVEAISVLGDDTHVHERLKPRRREGGGGGLDRDPLVEQEHADQRLEKAVAAQPAKMDRPILRPRQDVARHTQCALQSLPGKLRPPQEIPELGRGSAEANGGGGAGVTPRSYSRIRSFPGSGHLCDHPRMTSAPATRRRLTWTLVGTVGLGSSGNIAAVTVGTIAARDIAGSTALAASRRRPSSSGRPSGRRCYRA